MSDPIQPQSDELNLLLKRAVSGDRSMAAVVDALFNGASEAGATPLHHLATRFIEQRGEGSHIAPDEVRQHLIDSVLPRLASHGIVKPWDSGSDPDGLVRIEPSLWSEIVNARTQVGLLLRETGEHATETASNFAVPRSPLAGGSVLEAEGLVKVYRKRKVVNNVNVRVAQGEIVGLLGPNGAGKTTTFYMVVGLIDPHVGKIRIDGRDITRMPMYKRSRMGIGYLSQEPSIFRKLTVEENILTILETLPLSAAQRKERLESLLDELKIKHLRKSKAYQLSGGERRRLEITRALVTQPKFMMLDEPFAGVDPIAVHDIQSIVADLRRRGIGVLISDHNVEQTLDIVDRAYIMFEGQVKVSGTVRELVFNDAVAKDYLGPTLSARLRSRFLEADRRAESNDPFAMMV